MKHLVTISILLLLLNACNGFRCKKHSTATTATDSLINSTGANVPAEFRRGAKLITANDCFTCHQLDKKLTGPSYKDIAGKYSHNDGVVSNLVSGIINGSKGIWGEERMTPHPNLHYTDAREMVLYIFSLDSTHTKDTTGTRPVK
jgi:cytochrome c